RERGQRAFGPYECENPLGRLHLEKPDNPACLLWGKPRRGIAPPRSGPLAAHRPERIRRDRSCRREASSADSTRAVGPYPERRTDLRCSSATGFGGRCESGSSFGKIATACAGPEHKEPTSLRVRENRLAGRPRVQEVFVPACP